MKMLETLPDEILMTKIEMLQRIDIEDLVNRENWNAVQMKHLSSAFPAMLTKDLFT